MNQKIRIKDLISITSAKL